jgi:hypothetical protein
VIRRCRGALTILMICLLARCAAAQSDEWRIIDNSFLVEEAFNQERGVFQNILTWSRIRSNEWSASFTQEWPVPGVRHQLSYTIPFSKVSGVGGFDDLFINYRFQALSGENGGLAVSPRISLTVPDGDAAAGHGSGKVGLQVAVPASRQLGDFYLHANAGVTWIADAPNTILLAGSGIWRTTPMFHLMLEAVAQLDEAFTLAPGLRRGWGTEKQLVVGIAAPITWSRGSRQTALLTYFSYERPFRKLH